MGHTQIIGPRPLEGGRRVRPPPGSARGYIPHCNTFKHVYHLFSRYLSWQLSENCKQYTVKYMKKNTCFCKTVIFKFVVKFYRCLWAYQIVTLAIAKNNRFLYLNVLICSHTSMCLHVHSQQWVGFIFNVTHVHDVKLNAYVWCHINVKLIFL